MKMTYFPELLMDWDLIIMPIGCFSCNKKVGLTGFKCKCGSMYCGVHRYPEKHECSFDFKSIGRDAIAKANPLVKADKLERF